jgi:hypothetical protein
MSASDVDEYYLLCLECGRILFDDVEAADKSLRGQPITDKLREGRYSNPKCLMIFSATASGVKPKSLIKSL